MFLKLDLAAFPVVQLFFFWGGGGGGGQQASMQLIICNHKLWGSGYSLNILGPKCSLSSTADTFLSS